MSRLIYQLPRKRQMLVRGAGLLSYVAPLSIPATNFHPAAFLSLTAPAIATIFCPRFIFQLDRNRPLGTISIEHPLKTFPFLTKMSTFEAKTLKFPPSYNHQLSFTLTNEKPYKFFWYRDLVPEQSYNYCMGDVRGVDYQNVAHQILKYQHDKLAARKLPPKEFNAESKKLRENLERNATKLNDKKFVRQMFRK